MNSCRDGRIRPSRFYVGTAAFGCPASEASALTANIPVILRRNRKHAPRGPYDARPDPRGEPEHPNRIPHTTSRTFYDVQFVRPEPNTSPRSAMKFAKIIFWIAAIWGILVITPLYFLYDTIGRQDPPPITHPGFYYGFAGCALAWQLAFIVIARDPLRFRTMMLPSAFEKFSFGTATAGSTCNTVYILRISLLEESTRFSAYYFWLRFLEPRPRRRRRPEFSRSPYEPQIIFEVRQRRRTRPRASLNHPRHGRRKGSDCRLESQDNPAEGLPPSIHLQSSCHPGRQGEILHHRHALPSRAQDRRRDQYMDQEHGRSRS